MYSNYLKARQRVVLERQKAKAKDTPKQPDLYVNPSSKKVYYFVGGECKGYYDSITLCGNTLGMTRAMVKKAIDNGTTLENGFILKFINN